MRLVKQSAVELARVKEAVVPAGGPDPAAGGGAPPGMDPAAMGGAPPPGGDPAAMGGAPPPGGDPSMGAGAQDPALAAAGGGPQDMIRQVVQQVLMEQGGGKPGAAGGKTGKPDVAVELQRLNENFHKLGVLVCQVAKKQGVEVTPAMLFGPTPETADPALAAAASQPMGMTPGAGGQDPGQDPAAAGGAAPPEFPFPPPAPMSGDPADTTKNAGYDVDAIAKAAADIRASLALDDAGVDLDPLLGTPPAAFFEEKVATAPVGQVVSHEQLDVSMHQPLAMARMLRERARGR